MWIVIEVSKIIIQILLESKRIIVQQNRNTINLMKIIDFCYHI